jgi:hypothetical protein
LAKVRITAVPFKAGPAAHGPDFLVLPELFTAELLNFSESRDLAGSRAKDA